MTFEVAEGGFLDVDVKITGPDQKVVYSGTVRVSARVKLKMNLPTVTSKSLKEWKKWAFLKN